MLSLPEQMDEPLLTHQFHMCSVVLLTKINLTENPRVCPPCHGFISVLRTNGHFFLHMSSQIMVYYTVTYIKAALFLSIASKHQMLTFESDLSLWANDHECSLIG